MTAITAAGLAVVLLYVIGQERSLNNPLGIIGLWKKKRDWVGNWMLPSYFFHLNFLTRGKHKKKMENYWFIKNLIFSRILSTKDHKATKKKRVEWADIKYGNYFLPIKTRSFSTLYDSQIGHHPFSLSGKSFTSFTKADLSNLKVKICCVIVLLTI